MEEEEGPPMNAAPRAVRATRRPDRDDDDGRAPRGDCRKGEMIAIRSKIRLSNPRYLFFIFFKIQSRLSTLY